MSALREPFHDDEIGKLPRVTCKACRDANGKVCGQHAKSKCQVCNNYITGAHIHLDYVGHAEMTDRLLAVDPQWSWEPQGWGDDGMPLIVRHASNLVMWGRLTICGVTRLGVGTAPAGKDDAHKELIGDFLRNAGMRFGVALDLWRKSERHAEQDDAGAALDEAPKSDAPADGDFLAAFNALKPAQQKPVMAWLRDQGYRPNNVPAELQQRALEIARSGDGGASAETPSAQGAENGMASSDVPAGSAPDVPLDAPAGDGTVDDPNAPASSEAVDRVMARVQMLRDPEFVQFLESEGFNLDALSVYDLVQITSSLDEWEARAAESPAQKARRAAREAVAS